MASTAGATKKASKQKPKAAPALSEAERAARAQRIKDAAEKRANAWDDKLAKNRTKRNQEAAKSQSEQSEALSKGGTAANSAVENMKNIDDSVVQKRLEADAAKLNSSGFDVSQTVISSSSQARSAIVSGEPIVSPTPAAPTIATSSSNETTPDLDPEGKAQAMLDNAIDSGSIQGLERAIQHGSTIQDGSEQFAVKLASAIQMLEALRSKPDDPDPLAAALDRVMAALTVDANGKDSLRVLSKVLANIEKKPDEQKFRRLRLNNPKIQTMIVQFAQGTLVQVLKELGFVQVRTEKEDGTIDEELVLEDSNLNVFQAKSASIQTAIQDLLSQF